MAPSAIKQPRTLAYAADIGLFELLRLFQEAIDYLNVCKKLADNLGVIVV